MKHKRKLSHMQNDSNNRNKQRLKATKLHKNSLNQRRDFLHNKNRYVLCKQSIVE